MTRLLVALALAAALVSGCSLARETPAVRYYVLALEPAAPTAMPGPVRVGTFTADPAYGSARMAVRPSPYRIDYSSYHRWAAPPRSLVAATVRDYYAHVPDDGRTYLDVEGQVRRLETVRDGQGERAVIDVQLRAVRGGEVLVDRVYAEEEPLDGKGADAAAAATSRALGRALARFTADVAATSR
ncbi:MAG: membrane integrity-associated transporter subunit PqiC [bacterium]|nr:membrane integrity-associated transporter subunit PqiC [bacterium]